ncbi:MAG: hypothetical protein ACYDAD_09615 [Acidimicrobiales bacterium]
MDGASCARHAYPVTVELAEEWLRNGPCSVMRCACIQDALDSGDERGAEWAAELAADNDDTLGAVARGDAVLHRSSDAARELARALNAWWVEDTGSAPTRAHH